MSETFAFIKETSICKGFPCGSAGKESAYNAGDPGSIPGSGRSLGEGNGYPIQYSCLENYMENYMVGYSPRDLKESDMTEQLTLSLFNEPLAT